MKHLRLHLIMLVVAALATSTYFFSATTSYDRARWNLKQVKKSFRSADNPHGRWEYERMMLVDPATGEIPANIRQRELEFAETLPSRERRSILNKGTGTVAATWTSRGPFNVGGRTRALAYDISNDNIILAGGVSGGMWRSTNGGSSWTRTTSLAISVQSVTCLAQDTRSGKTNTWYYGTGEFLGNSATGGGPGFYHGDGIYKSTDGGITWNVLSSTVSGTPHQWDGDFDYVWNIVVDRSNTTQDEVYAAVYGGIKRSTNGGTSWSNSLVADQNLASGAFVDVAITSNGVVYGTVSSDATSQEGIFRSTDGVTWSNITPAGFPSIYRRIVIGIAPSNENIVYFLAETPSSGVHGHSLWLYNASTGTWTDRSVNIPSFGGAVGNFDSQRSYDLVIRVKPDDPNFVLIGGTNLYRSTDGFATAANVSWIGGYSPANDISRYPNQHPDQHALIFHPSNPNVLLAGHDGGVSRTTNIQATSVSWTLLNNGYLTTQFYTLAVDQATAGNNVVIGGMQDNGTYFVNSASPTASWTDIFSGDGAYCAITDNRTAYYVSSQNGTTYRLVLSSTGSLQAFRNVTPANASGFLFINPFQLDPNDNRRMYMAGGRTIWRNNDLSAVANNNDNNKLTTNWDSLSTSTISNGSITSLAVSRTPANRLYFGTSAGQAYRMENAHMGNPTRSSITGFGFPSNGFVSCIAIDPANADNVLLVFSNYNVHSLFWSTNGGTSWTTVGGNLEQNPDGTGNGPSVRWATILPTGTSTMYLVGTSVGLYSTTTLNGMQTVWAQEGANVIGKVVVPMVISRPVDGLVVAGTHANGIYTATITGSTSVELVDGFPPERFELLQNYPNPFNPTTTIRFSLPSARKVRLVVIDVAGRVVRELVDEEKAPGTYSVVWNGKDRSGFDVGSGTYFYRLESGGDRSVRRMILVR
jgi:hypothetical protein